MLFILNKKWGCSRKKTFEWHLKLKTPDIWSFCLGSFNQNFRVNFISWNCCNCWKLKTFYRTFCIRGKSFPAMISYKSLLSNNNFDSNHIVCTTWFVLKSFVLMAGFHLFPIQVNFFFQIYFLYNEINFGYS